MYDLSKEGKERREEERKEKTTEVEESREERDLNGGSWGGKQRMGGRKGERAYREEIEARDEVTMHIQLPTHTSKQERCGGLGF